MKFLIRNYSLITYVIMPLLITFICFSSIIFFIQKNNELDDLKLDISKSVTEEIVTELILINSISELDQYKVYGLADLIFYSNLSSKKDIDNIHKYIKTSLNAKSSLYTETMTDLVLYKHNKSVQDINNRLDNLNIYVNITFIFILIISLLNILLLYFENRIKIKYNDN